MRFVKPALVSLILACSLFAVEPFILHQKQQTVEVDLQQGTERIVSWRDQWQYRTRNDEVRTDDGRNGDYTIRHRTTGTVLRVSPKQSFVQRIQGSPVTSSSEASLAHARRTRNLGVKSIQGRECSKMPVVLNGNRSAGYSCWTQEGVELERIVILSDDGKVRREVRLLTEDFQPGVEPPAALFEIPPSFRVGETSLTASCANCPL